jgi:hypothetical protein
MGLASGLIHTGDNQVQYFKFTADRKWVMAPWETVF